MKIWVLTSLLLPALALVKALPHQDDFLVKGLEEIYPAYATFNGTMFAGVLSVEFEDVSTEMEEGQEYMFWLFAPHHPGSTDSIAVWFNGGPGCSSFHAGMMLENGPVTTHLHPAGYFAGPEENLNPMIENKYSWTKATTMLYIEQPTGIGFSHGGSEPQNETDVGRSIYGFLQNFFKVFPKQNGKRIFLTGESYGGMYIPSVGYYIHEKNKLYKKTKPERVLNLAGMGIGNGWVDARIQGPVVIDYAWWHGMIDSVTKDALWSEWNHCAKHYYDSQTSTDEEPEPFHRFTIPDECGMMEAVLLAAGAGVLPRGNPNTYDVTTWDPYDLLNSGTGSTDKFFNNIEVQKILNVDPLGTFWMGCIKGAGRRRNLAEEVGSNTPKEQTQRRLQPRQQQQQQQQGLRHLHLLDDDRPFSVVPYMAELLDEARIDVLVYNGDRDMSTCVQGSEMALNGMEWSGHDDWLDPDVYQRGIWLASNGQPAGYVKTVKNLQFVSVYNSGHLVPFNQPKNALDLISRLVHGQTFLDKVIPVVYTKRSEFIADNDDLEETKTSWSKAYTMEELIILVFLSFAFGYATSLLLSRLTSRCFGDNPKGRGYETVPNVGQSYTRSNSGRTPTRTSSSNSLSNH